MKDSRPQTTAQRLLNLYRQYHVVNGKWAALNPVFMNEGSAEVLSELEKLPTGGKLAQHIKNLKAGKTQRDSIDSELLPYNGMMEIQATNGASKLPEHDMTQLAKELRGFVPNAENLERIKSLPLIKNLGDNWREAVAIAVANSHELASAWDVVIKLDTATELWFKAGRILASVPSERLKAEIQADMLKYENFLPMFGGAGADLLEQLKRILSTQPEQESAMPGIAVRLGQ